MSLQIEGIEELALRRAVQRLELFVARETPCALHRHESLSVGRERHGDPECRLVAEPTICLRLINASHRERNCRRAARGEIIGELARRGRRQEERRVEPVRLREREIKIGLHERLQPLHRVLGAEAANDRLPRGDTVMHEGVEQLVLVLEMAVERHRREVRSLGDPANGKPLEACGFEHCFGGREYAILGHAYTVY